ncbi:MAG TPA: hypothetical protein VNG33_07635, partial [Polyangiaceae bacterium]|nr:hypothetical protein [Polyangiaceae bacterium]
MRPAASAPGDNAARLSTSILTSHDSRLTIRSRTLGASVERGRDADLAFEGAAESRFGAVADAVGDLRDARFAASLLRSGKSS